MKSKIKLLEKKYLGDGNANIPVIDGGQMYGRPLFWIELIRNIRKKDAPIEKLFVGIPNLEKLGYTVGREIECYSPAFALGNDSEWNMINFCKEHRAARINFYQPRDILPKRLVISLYSGIMIGIKWESK